MNEGDVSTVFSQYILSINKANNLDMENLLM